MKLIYRGANYEYNLPSLEVNERDVLRRNQDAAQRCRTLQEANYPLFYRGDSYTTSQVAGSLSTPVPHSPRLITYRGLDYVKNPDGTIEFATAARPSLTSRKTIPVLREISKTHRENLRRNLEHRLEAARQRGDEGLINLLEAEYRELTL